MPSIAVPALSVLPSSPPALSSLLPPSLSSVLEARVAWEALLQEISAVAVPGTFLSPSPQSTLSFGVCSEQVGLV